MLPMDRLAERKRFHFDNLYLDAPNDYDSVILYQIGDLSCKEGYEVEDHTQFCYEISYIFSGEGFFYSNNNKYSVKQGDIYINVPGDIHRIESGKCKDFRYFYLGFTFDEKTPENTSLLNIKRKLDNLNSPLKKDTLNIDTPFLCALKELRNRNEFSYIMINSYLHEILILMYRNFFSEHTDENYYSSFTGSQKEIAYNATSFIDNNLLKISELTEISSTLGYSYSYLSHVFREEMGITLQNYYANKKLNKAKELLLEDTLSITKISEVLKYESIHSFSKAFKKAVGISPRQYKVMDKNLLKADKEQ